MFKNDRPVIACTFFDYMHKLESLQDNNIASVQSASFLLTFKIQNEQPQTLDRLKLAIQTHPIKFTSKLNFTLPKRIKNLSKGRKQSEL